MGAIEQTTCVRYSSGVWSRESVAVPSERPLTIYVNGKEMVTLLCTPVKLNFLAFGLLFSDGIIESVKDVASMRVCDDESEVDVRLTRSDVHLSEARTLTSGCGGGSVSTVREIEKLRVTSDFSMSAEQVVATVKRLLEAAETHREYGGLHTSVLAGGEGLIAVAEDIGRHNTLDKIAGECLLRGIPMHGHVLVCTGRMSSEMLLKAGRMGVPVVISRSAITGRAAALANDLGITAVGYARGERFTVYTHPQRVNGAGHNVGYGVNNGGKDV